MWNYVFLKPIHGFIAISQNMKAQQIGEMNPPVVTSNRDFIRKVEKVTVMQGWMCSKHCARSYAIIVSCSPKNSTWYYLHFTKKKLPLRKMRVLSTHTFMYGLTWWHWRWLRELAAHVGRVIQEEETWQVKVLRRWEEKMTWSNWHLKRLTLAVVLRTDCKEPRAETRRLGGGLLQ